MFLPALLVEVFDTRPIKDVMVGTASIPLRSFAPWVQQDRGEKKKYVYANNFCRTNFAYRYVDLPPVVNEEAFFQPPVEVPLIPPLPAAEPHVVCAHFIPKL